MTFENSKELRAGKGVGLVIPDLGDQDKTLSVWIGELRDDVEDSKIGHPVYATLPNNVIPSV